MSAVAKRASSSRPASATSLLLACGIAAGPLYVVVGALEMFTRPGFDPLRHDLSLMANGDLGWIHTSLLIVSGLLVVASAIGMRNALGNGLGSTWAPRLIALYGVGLIGAGIFAADPAYGFPPGTPADAHDVSFHGLMHLVSGSVGFVALIAACFVVARRFAALRQVGWAVYSRLTGVVFAAAFIGIGSGSGQGGVFSTMVILAFTAAVVLGWAWISAVELELSREAAA